MSSEKNQYSTWFALLVLQQFQILTGFPASIQMIHLTFQILNQLQWRIQDFPDEAATPNLLFGQFFTENCMKTKKFGPISANELFYTSATDRIRLLLKQTYLRFENKLRLPVV